MTSPAEPFALLRKLSHGDRGLPPSTGFSCEVDFDSALVFADLRYDSSLPSSHYPEAARAELQAILACAADAIGTVPEALAFVNEHLQRVLIRHADGGATSSSNRDHVGTCVLTNLQDAPDRVLVCVEALVHEATHQSLYRVEREAGNFCDLDASRRFRSPWSGNRIPLHSLIHASFVYFGLLGFWCRYAQTVSDPAQAARVRDRMARCLFGYAFIAELLDRPAFPRASVQPAIVDAIRDIAEAACVAELSMDGQGSVRDALGRCQESGWLARLAASLQRIAGSGVATLVRA